MPVNERHDLLSFSMPGRIYDTQTRERKRHIYFFLSLSSVHLIQCGMVQWDGFLCGPIPTQRKPEHYSICYRTWMECDDFRYSVLSRYTTQTPPVCVSHWDGFLWSRPDQTNQNENALGSQRRPNLHGVR